MSFILRQAPINCVTRELLPRKAQTSPFSRLCGVVGITQWVRAYKQARGYRPSDTYLILVVKTIAGPDRTLMARICIQSPLHSISRALRLHIYPLSLHLLLPHLSSLLFRLMASNAHANSLYI